MGIAGCSENMFVTSKMDKKTYLRYAHPEKKSVGGASIEHAVARVTQEGGDDGADDGAIDDVSADDGVLKLPGAPSVDDVSADDAGDDGSIDDVSADDGVVRLPGAPSVDDVSADDAGDDGADDGADDD